MGDRSQLGDLEELALLAVLRLGDDAYGARIREELRGRAHRSVSISTIYVTLMRLEERGLARSWMGEPSGERGGKAKRHFEVRPEGMAALEATRAVRERMWEGLRRPRSRTRRVARASPAISTCATRSWSRSSPSRSCC